MAAVAILGLAAFGVGWAFDALSFGGDRHADFAGIEARRQATAGSHFRQQVLADEWSDRIATESFWRNRRPGGNGASANISKSKPSRLQGPQPEPGWFIAPAPTYWGQPPLGFGVPQGQPAPHSMPRSHSGYRTVCVRLCDGFFFPISFGVSEGSLGRDQTTCSNSCAGARLFYGKSGNDDPDDMVDLNGQRYSKLPNANLFRTQYSESCKCKPHSWEEASVVRHRIFALEDQRRKGNRAVVAELETLKSKQLTDRRTIDRRTGGRRESSRSRKRWLGEEFAGPTRQTGLVGEPMPAPRSDVSRGQGAADRSSQPAMTTGALAAPVTVAEQRTALSGSAGGAPAAAVGDEKARGASRVAGNASTGVSAPITAGISHSLGHAGSQHVQLPIAEMDGRAGGAQSDEAVAGHGVVPAKSRGGRGKGRELQASSERPGIMRLGGGAPRVQGTVTVTRQQSRTAEWVGRIFAAQ